MSKDANGRDVWSALKRGIETRVPTEPRAILSPCDDWPHCFALSSHRRARDGWHGRGLSRRGSAINPQCRREVSAGRRCRGSRRHRSLPARGTCRLLAQSSTYLHCLRRRRPRGAAVPRDGAARRRHAQAANWRRAHVGGPGSGLGNPAGGCAGRGACSGIIHET